LSCEGFEVFAVLQLRIMIFWDVTLHHRVTRSCYFEVV